MGWIQEWGRWDGYDGTNLGSVDAENLLEQKNEVLQNHEIRFRDFLQHLIRLVGVIVP